MGREKVGEKNWECEQGSMRYLAVYQKFGFHCLKSKLGPLKMFLFMNFGVLSLGENVFIIYIFLINRYVCHYTMSFLCEVIITASKVHYGNLGLFWLWFHHASFIFCNSSVSLAIYC